jgi:aldose 1-epimerase
MGQTWPDTVPTDVTLTAGEATLAVDLRGGGPRALTVGAWPVIDGYAAGAVPSGSRGAVLVPWPNRIRDGRWTWQGRALQLPVASPQHPNAMHGLVAWQPWQLLAGGAHEATDGTTVEARPGYPFRLVAAIDYRLEPEGLTSTVRVRNVGREPAPFGAGLHPYLYVGGSEDGDLAEADLRLPARTHLVLDGGLPTGERRPFDGAVGRIGDRVFDDAFTDLERDGDGWARTRLSGPSGSLELDVDDTWRWLQVYSADTLPEGQRRRSLAVEPMTCPPNALADGVDVLVLEPDEEWSGTWVLSWTPR